MAPGLYEYASLAVLNGVLAAFVLLRARRSWLARVLGALFAINVVSPVMAMLDTLAVPLGPAVYFAFIDAQSFASLVALAMIPGLVYRESTGRGQRLLPLLALPALGAGLVYLGTRVLVPGPTMGGMFLALQVLPWALVLVAGVIALLDLVVRTRDPVARQRTQFFLAAFVLATVTTFEIPLDLETTTGAQVALARGIEVALLGAFVLPIATFMLQRLRHLASAPAPSPFTRVEWLLVLATPAVAAALAIARQPELGYGLIRPILLTSGILWLGIVGEGPAIRPLAAAAVVAAAAATSLWVVALGDVPAVAPLLGVALALLLAWPLAREALGHSPQRNGRTLYEAALSASLAEGRPHDAPVLRELRARLGISDKEHGVIEMRLRQGTKGLAPASVLFGRYRVQRRLGGGATGATYLAHDEQLGRDVALKLAQVPTDEGAERLLHEARTLARLRHPNIPRLLDVERVGQDVLLVMEYVDGEPLDKRLRRGPLPLAEGLRVAEDVLGALATLHAEGLLHRDVKPSNVVLAADGRAYLIDFGIAVDAARTLTHAGDALPAGTVAYMSPEQLTAGAIDARSDLFSLAATLYESLCGQTYFPLGGRDLQEIAAAVGHDRPRWPEELPAPLAKWLMRALEKDPRARPASAGEMLGDLRTARPLFHA